MPLPKSNLPINFSQGIDSKTDPKQVQPGKFLSLVNSVFDTGALKKRNGFGFSSQLPVTNTTTLTTFAGSLTAIGKSLYNYAPETSAWYSKGSITGATTDVVPLYRSASGQSRQDVAVTSTGFSCAVWADSDGTSKYQINDVSSGQAVGPAVSLVATANQARVFVLGRYFVVTYIATISAASHLQFVAIPISAPNSPNAAVDIGLQCSSLTAGYDACVVSGALYVAWSDVAPKLKLTYITSTLTVAAPLDIATRQATYMAVTADMTTTTPTIYLAFWDGGNSNLYGAAYSTALAEVLAPTIIINSTSIVGVTAVATAGVLSAYYQTSNTYTYSSVRSDYISTKTMTQAGVVSSATVVLRGVALASKAFYLNSTTYMMVAYGGAFQPTYFLIDSSGNVIAKLAYENGGGYPASQVLPGANVTGNSVQVGYLFKDLLTPVNDAQGVANVAGIYSQTGVNLATWTINDMPMVPAEIGGSLHLAGGILWQYDGTRPVEQGFHVWPEDLAAVGSSTSGSVTLQQYYYVATYEWTDAAGNTHRSAPSVPLGYLPVTAPANFTGNRTSGSAVLAAVSSFTGLQVGQPISGTGIPANTYILSLNSGASTLTMSANATSGTATATTVTPTTVSSISVNVPTYRPTYKVGASKVRIVVYRWSTAQQNYYQVTSITSPTLNDVTTDSVAIVDSLADASILGNQLLYTTGGTVENIAFPAASVMTLFKSRLVAVSAEDKNLIWFSKQVIESTPVEGSDLFTQYIAPTTGAQGSTGAISAISAMDDKLVLFKRDAIYYITGTGPDNTGANNDFSEPNYITSTAGCTNQASVVYMPQGLMFQSDKGIWLLARDLSTTYIGAPVERYNGNTVLSAVNVPGTNQVRFTLDNGVTLMYDYFFGQWGTFEGIPGVSSTLFQSLHTYVNQYGLVFQETPGLYLDGTSPVCMSFLTGWMSLAGLQGYERAYYFYLLGEYLSPHKLSIGIAHDYNPAISQSVTISPDNYNPVYGSYPGVYGSEDPYGGNPTDEQWRVFLEKQKCQSFQLSLTESFDASYGTVAGAGFILSGLNLVVGAKKGYASIKPSRSAG